MIQTKLCELNVICESCNMLEHPIFIKNQNNDKCDLCGFVRNKVMYIENHILKQHIENQELGKLFN
jgi:hypothetical protein